MSRRRLRSRLWLRLLCRGGWSLVRNLLQMLQVMVSFMWGNSNFGRCFFRHWCWLNWFWCWCFGSWCWSWCFRSWCLSWLCWGFNRLLWRDNRSSRCLCRRWSFWGWRQWLKINWISLLFLSNPLVRVFPCSFCGYVVWRKWRARVHHFERVFMAAHCWVHHGGMVQLGIVHLRHGGPFVHLFHLFEQILRRRSNRC